jgi:hypothetical protein
VCQAEHSAQILHGFLVTGAWYADFCSWDPRFPEPLQLFVVRVERNDFEVMAYQRAVQAFLEEVDRECREVEAMVA